ncbi:MAG TPA: WhiB family transcriptional regulator, partial [Acidimicrobiales bacterium]|nr:WhiB family transcriptional regulator [Acidimicrobiales bacterium]
GALPWSGGAEPAPPGPVRFLDALAEEKPKKWIAEAACRGLDPDMFFTERGDTRGQWAAKSICAKCPVCADCLDYAMATPREAFGIWGATSEKERRKLRGWRK